MLDLFRQGGPLMWPLLACSVLALGIFFTKLLYYLKIRSGGDLLFKEIIGLVQEKRYEESLVVCQRSDSPLGRVMAAVLKMPGQPREKIKTIAVEVAGREGAPLEHYLGLLSTIANVSPLIGLLGTVLGMIHAFQVIAAEGVGTPATLGGGISQALITTAAGMTVAIPAILAHRYLTGKMQRISLEMEDYILRVVDQVGE